ncbi:hypothetical protein SAZ_00530 [Streptomyces noursei ZPM]|nr:hypothetical protein SAZ_00530 [Streptomyces noursei ZPM]EPY93434.1 hypothetical protein K530_47885 [Streptomyces noursei CCRC 11814]EXU92477.1 hypothetical protein P354_21585 [Streptomyces noursei PD-1]
MPQPGNTEPQGQRAAQQRTRSAQRAGPAQRRAGTPEAELHLTLSADGEPVFKKALSSDPFAF